MRGLRFWARRQQVVALAMIAIIVFVALAAPVLSPPGRRFEPPGFKRVGFATDGVPHPPTSDSPLGTSAGQYDVLHTVLWGARSALGFGLVVALASAAIGILIGAAAGYAGGRTNAIALRVTDAFLAFPVLAGFWFFALILYPPGGVEPVGIQEIVARLKIPPLLVVFILFSWMPYMRLVNTNVRRLKDGEAIIAARSVGVPPWRLILRHLLPVAIAPAVVLIARDVGLVVIMQANFAFIGVDKSSPWGVMLAANRNWIIGPGGNPFIYWWAFLPVTLALIFFAIAWNLAGDSINDALNPRRSR